MVRAIHPIQKISLLLLILVVRLAGQRRGAFEQQLMNLTKMEMFRYSKFTIAGIVKSQDIPGGHITKLFDNINVFSVAKSHLN